MKSLYWRPTQVSRIELVLIALVAWGCFMASEHHKSERHQPYYRDKMEAARLAQRGFDMVKAERLSRGMPIDAEIDPLQTGLIGTLLTPITTHAGDLGAKKTSVNPNFAAVILEWLRQSGVASGDAVAVGMSGSFPALNIATLAALQVVQARPLILVSAAASQWGANDPNFVWLDMNRMLAERGLFSVRPLGASRGGIGDSGVGLSNAGRIMLDAAIDRSGLKKLTAPNYEASLAEHMEVYRKAAGGAPIKAYINVGAGTTSVGTHIGKKLFQPGLNGATPDGRPIIDSVMQRFANEGVPVIHLLQIKRLAAQFGLPTEPDVQPQPGQGGVFSRPAYSVTVAAAGLTLIVATMVAFLRLDIGIRLRRASPNAPVGPGARV